MVAILRFFKTITLIICVILLSQCTKVGSEHPTRGKSAITTPFSMPADAYLALARNQTGQEQNALLLMAAGRLIYDGQWQQGQGILAQLHELSPDQLAQKNIFLAKIALIRGQPRVAISHCSSVQGVGELAIFYQVQFHEILANAYQAIGQYEASVVERIKLDKLLPDETAKANNRRALWLALTLLPQAELDTLSIETTDNTELNGWLQLAMISRKHYTNPDALLLQIEHWQAQYPNHPAQRMLPNPLNEHLFATPKHMALLLPLSGPVAGPGNAVKDGFMAAYEASGTTDSVKVRLYNTHSTDVAALYQQAIENGADYVVGPLLKADVATVAGMSHPVPTLLLNDLEKSTKNNAYQFGISPTSEARQVAAKARKQGHSRILIIAPEGAWGDDIANAFTQQWRSSGGLVVDTLHYGAHDDLNLAIQRFLRVTDSEARGKQIKRVLGTEVVTTPARRQDFDSIFLLAYPTKARQIMPLLKYYYAGDVPVYATSNVYSGTINTMKDRDLDGIIFCDMPWVFSHQMGNRGWPEQFNSYNRLYALGMDSYALSNQLNQLLLFPALGVSDKSGVLYLNPTNQISRILVFGQFRQGTPQLLAKDNEG